ncbi:MAG: anti-sigma factor [Acidimicrobiia bacterium]
MGDDRRLLRELGEALGPPLPPTDPGRVAALRDEVARRREAVAAGLARPDASPSAPAVRRRRRLVPSLAAAAAAVVLVAVGVVVGRAVDDDGPNEVAGELEYDGPLQGPAGAGGQLQVVKTGIGRVITLRTEDLPVLPTGELYEIWFLSPDDGPGTPDRISAGTFHPDAGGRSHVTFAAAVDPALYPVVSITAEPGDGDPAPSAVEVLRAQVG